MIILPEDKAIITILSEKDAKEVFIALVSEESVSNELSPQALIVYTVITERNKRISEKKSNAGKQGGAPKNNQNAKKQAEQADDDNSNETTLRTDTDTVSITVSETSTDTVTEEANASSGDDPASGDEAAVPIPVPYKKIMNVYNSTCTRLRKIKSIDGKRKTAVEARFKTYGYDEFVTLFQKANASNFLCGEGEKNWMADFDWLISATNMAKVLEGKYENKQQEVYKPPPPPSKNPFINAVNSTGEG